MQIVIKNLQKKKIPIVPKKVKQATLNILKSCGIKRAGEVAICFVDDRKIRSLNRRYLNKDYPTDVLCFDLSNGKEKFYADIFISVDTARRNARRFKSSFRNELYRYVIHAALHLAGFDDLTQKQKKLMRKKEEDFLRWL